MTNILKYKDFKIELDDFYYEKFCAYVAVPEEWDIGITIGELFPEEESADIILINHSTEEIEEKMKVWIRIRTEEEEGSWNHAV